jgi:hypothetical protein
MWLWWSGLGFALAKGSEVSHVTRRRVCGTPMVAVAVPAANWQPTRLVTQRIHVIIKSGTGSLKTENYSKYSTELPEPGVE